MTWPEHPETFKDNRLICNAPNFSPEKLNKRIPNLIFETNEETDEESDEESAGLCKMTQSKHFHKSLLRTVHSIYHHKTTPATTNSTDTPISSLDPRLAHSIARRTALLLQSVFIRSALNRQSALRVLKQFQHINETVDVDNVTSNWETTKMATEQLIGQAALDQETFDNFSSRLNGTFK